MPTPLDVLLDPVTLLILAMYFFVNALGSLFSRAGAARHPVLED